MDVGLCRGILEHYGSEVFGGNEYVKNGNARVSVGVGLDDDDDEVKE